MYCTQCGQSVIEDIWGNLIHDYLDKDAHYPELAEEHNG